MADVKISALPAATTPLDGTELAPIVQSGTTKRVTVANLTVGRALTASSLTLTTPLSVANGGTGLTSLTAGYIPFGAGTSAFGSDSDLFWDNTNKRLGVGTASPGALLDLTGGVWVQSQGSEMFNTITRTGAGANANYIGNFTWRANNASSVLKQYAKFLVQQVTSTAGSEDGLLILQAAKAGTLFSGVTINGNSDAVIFGNSGGERARIDASGNFGIGVTPATKLHVYTGSATITTSRLENSVALVDTSVRADGSVWGGYATPAASTWMLLGTSNSTPLYFYTNGSERMRIASDGSVGIAQTGPNNYLCIGPSTSTTGAPTYTGFLRLGSHSSQSLSSNGGLEFVAATGSNGYGFRICGVDLGSGSAPLVFQYRAGSATWSEALRIDQSGNVIAASGTATPANGSTSARLLFGTTAGFGIYYGSGAPTVSAAQGSIYLRSDGSSTSTRLYVNTNGSTTWTNVTTAA